MSRKNVLIAIGVVLVGAAVVGANLYFKKDKGLTVTTEVVKTRDLEAIVVRVGKDPAEAPRQHQRRHAGPRRRPRRQRRGSDQEGPVPAADRPEVAAHPRRQQHAAVAARLRRQASLEQMRQSIETARVQLEQAQQNLTRQQNLWAQQLTTREALEKAENDVKAAQSALQEREKPTESGQRAGEPHRAGAGDARQRALRPEQDTRSSRRSTASSRAATSRRAKRRSSAR